MSVKIAPLDANESALLAAIKRDGIPHHPESYDGKIAWLMAFIANLAYRPFDENGGVALPELAGLFRLAATFGNEGSEAILLEADTCRILAYRGTLLSEFADIRAHVNALKKPAAHGAGNVHSGFRAAYDHIAPMIDAALAKTGNNKPLLITGHSLGGALATIAAREHHAAVCYSFGAPRVGDAAWVAAIKTPIFRVVNAIDCVTMLPMNRNMTQSLKNMWGFRFAGFFENIGGYTHAGQEIFMTSCPIGKYDGVKMIDRVPGFQNLKILLRCLAARGFVRDHGILVYRRKLAVLSAPISG